MTENTTPIAVKVPRKPPQVKKERRRVYSSVVTSLRAKRMSAGVTDILKMIDYQRTGMDEKLALLFSNPEYEHDAEQLATGIKYAIRQLKDANNALSRVRQMARRAREKGDVIDLDATEEGEVIV